MKNINIEKIEEKTQKVVNHINEEIKRQRTDIKIVEARCDYMKELARDIRWYMVDVTDEDGEKVLDENGEVVKREPTIEDGWTYKEYIVRTQALELLAGAWFK